ncbi:MAG: STAS domain-containing protein [Gammaproteobacteria bacterium]
MSGIVLPSSDGNTLNIGIIGEFSLSVRVAFVDAYKSKKGQYDKYVIDLSDCDQADNAAIDMLLEMQDYLDADKEALWIKDCEPFVQNIIEQADIQKMFTIDLLS